MATWTIDPAHSDITFKVKHLMISTVKGEFKDFSATMEADAANGFEEAIIQFRAKIDSITTGNTQRDEHLKSADFFDAASYPELSFTSTAFHRLDEDKFQLEGHLSIRGTTKPVVLEGEYNGVMVDFYGNTKAGFDLRGKINRHDFGLEWSAVTEAGGIVVSDEVRLELNIQMMQSA